MKGIIGILLFICGLILVGCESPHMDIQIALGCCGLGMLLLGAILAQAGKEQEDVLYRQSHRRR